MFNVCLKVIAGIDATEVMEEVLNMLVQPITVNDKIFEVTIILRLTSYAIHNSFS